MIRTVSMIAVILAAGCGGPGEQPAAEPVRKAAPAEQVRDETHRFHKEGLVEARVVESSLGGKDFMPGGNFAVYERNGKRHEVFFALRRDNEQATFLVMDYRTILADHKFIAHFGGFYGMDGETPTLVFQKNRYVVVVAGLELEEADHAGRLIAGYLN